MSEELFSASEVESKSPKLKWKERYGVLTWYHPTDKEWMAGFKAWRPAKEGPDFFFHECVANGYDRIGVGDDEDSAIANLLSCSYARNLGIKLWNEES